MIKARRSKLLRTVQEVPPRYVFDETKSYWSGQGLHKEKHETLSNILTELVKQAEKKGVHFFHENADSVWTLFNGMVGMYHGYYNDGDDAHAAIANNRVHGFDIDDDGIDDFKDLARKYGADKVLLYIDRTSKSYLEQAMDQVIEITYEKLLESAIKL